MTEEIKKQEMEQMSYYDLAKLLQKVSESLLELPKCVTTWISEDVAFQVNELQYATKKLELVYKEFSEKVGDHESAMEKLADEAYDRISKNVKSVNDRINKLPKIGEIRLPYNLEETIKVCERLACLSDKEFERLIDVLNVFVNK